MATVAVRHAVADFDAWKIAYDEHGVARKELGCIGDAVFRGEGNTNEVLVLTHWPTLAAAHEFADDPALPEAMARGGVQGPPRIEFYDEVAL